MLEEYQIYLDALNRYTPLKWEFDWLKDVYRLTDNRLTSYEVRRSISYVVVNTIYFDLITYHQDIDSGVVEENIELFNQSICAIIERINDMENPKGV